MNVLTVESVSKNYGTKPLLERITFGIGDDERMGLIGANGSGKTTLMRLVAGLEPPDSGRIMVPNGKRVAYLPQNPDFDPEQTVLDAVFDQGDEALRLLHDYEAVSHRLAQSGGDDEALLQRFSDLSHQLDVTGGWDLEAQARALLDRLGLSDFDAEVGTLSGGERKRVALARALLLRPDLLLLDEPTNHLDTETITWLEAYLARYAGALLLVTHDRYFLDRVTNRMLEVDRSGVKKYEGNYSRYLEQKEEQEQIEEATAQTRRNLARRELAWLRRGAKARTSKSKYRVEQAKALQEDLGPGRAQSLELSAASTRLGKKVIELDRVSKRFDETILVRDYSAIITKGDRIGIIGPNGVGKTTLLEIIAGRMGPDTGNVVLGPTTEIGYFDQEGRPLNDDLRVIDTVKEVAENVRTADGSIITASQMLERFLFPPAVQYTPVGLLSGGERRRLHLLLVLMSAPNVLLLDEPTNDLDIPTLMALEAYLDSFPGVLLTVSHDRWFLDRTVDHLLHFEGDGRIKSYPGNYSAYLEQRPDETASSSPSKPQPPAEQHQAPDTTPSGGGKLSYKERRELDELEARIAAAEARQLEIESLLAAAPTDFEAVATLTKELTELSHQLDHAVERWAELAERE